MDGPPASLAQRCALIDGHAAEQDLDAYGCARVPVRPAPGARGHARHLMRRGVSRLHSGRRYTLGIIFHDAA